MVGGEERAVQGLPQLGDLPPHPGPRHLREDFGVALSGDDGAEHVPAGHAVDVADHRRQLQVRVLQQLLAARFLGGAGLDQPPAVAGVGAEPADVLRRHEAARQRALLGDPGQPCGVQPVGLRPPGQRLDLRRLVEQAVQALPLQQEVHRLPVVAGGLHPGPLHLPAAQPVRHLQQLAAGGAELPRLLLPAAPAGVAGHPDRDADQLLADVDPGGPLAEQRLVPGLFHHGLLS